jgi:hypothetical protein
MVRTIYHTYSACYKRFSQVLYQTVYYPTLPMRNPRVREGESMSKATAAA